METRDQLEKKFGTARSNLIAVIAFTIINVFLVAVGAEFYFLFSANIPLYLLSIVSEISMVVGVVLALAAISIYMICWFLSQKNGVWIVVALAFFAIDGLVLFLFLLLVGFVGGFEVSLLMDLGFYVLIMYYLIIGTRAWFKLKDMPQEDYYDPEQGQAYAVNSNDGVALQRQTIAVSQIPPTMPLRQQSDKGRVLVSHNYYNVEISVIRAFGVTELVVGGTVYAEMTGVLERNTYILEANVSNVIVSAIMEIPSTREVLRDEILPSVYLYANGYLLASKTRNY